MIIDSIDICFFQYLRVFFNKFPENNIFIFYAFVVYEPAERNFHFNWLHSLFTWLLLYYKEVTKSLFRHVTLCAIIFLQMKFYRKLKYANLVERKSILTLSYRATRSWSLCLYFFKWCFLLDAVREKYSYISHSIHLHVAKNSFNNFFMTWAHKEFAYLL